MIIREHSRDRLGRAICLAALFLLLFSLFRLFPLVGDDWFREALGSSLHSPLDLFREVAHRWSTVNGRILGNILAYSAGSRPLLRQIMYVLFTLALIVLLSRTFQQEPLSSLLFCTFLLLALPKEMFVQIYPWAAGFFNYVPPVVMLLASLELVRPVLEGQPLEEHPARGAALFLLGFGQQLFIENNTLYALCVSFALLVWYWLERRRWSPSLLAFFLGCVLGGALLFASPSYRLITQDGGAYQSGLGGGLAGLVASAAETLPLLIEYLLLDRPALFGISFLPWMLTLSLLSLYLKKVRKKVWQDWLIAGVLFLYLLTVNFRWSTAAAAVWWLVFAVGLWRWTPDRLSRAQALFFWFSAPVAAAPLLFVSPIGPRCLFLSYVLMLGTQGVLCQRLVPNRWVGCLGAALLMVFLFTAYFRTYLPLHQTEQRRTQAIQAALASGQTQVAIPPYQHDGWLWDADNADKMEQYYYREHPGDLTISFTP